MATEKQASEKKMRKMILQDFKVAKKIIINMKTGNTYDIAIDKQFYNLEFIQDWLRIEKKNFIFNLKFDQISEISIEC